MKWSKFEKNADQMLIMEIKKHLNDNETPVSIKVAKKIVGHKKTKKGTTIVEKEGIRLLVKTTIDDPEALTRINNIIHYYTWIFDKDLVKATKAELRKIKTEVSE